MTSKKTKRVEVRFTEEQFSIVADLAEKSSLTVSEIVRESAVSTEVVTLKPPRKMSPRDKQMVVQVARAGASLNQIAKHCNTYKSDSDTLRVLAELLNIESKLEVLLNAYQSQ